MMEECDSQTNVLLHGLTKEMSLVQYEMINLSRREG